MRTKKTSPKNISLRAMLLAGSLVLALPAHAQNKKVTPPAPTTPSAPTAPVKGDQVDISDIENKYWAPKDTDFNVVQNRTYTKEKRFSLSAQYGPVVNETLNEGTGAAFGMNYYFTERWGLQLNYTMFMLKNSPATQAFIDAGGGPDYGRAKNMYDIGLNWIPFYAKMSVIGKKIIYFDMAITPTIGMMNYEQRTLLLGDKQQSAMTYGFDITQLFFMHKNFAIKVDYKQRYYKEEIIRYYGAGAGGKVKDKSSDNTSLMFGLAVFF